MSTQDERREVESLVDELRSAINTLQDEARSYCDVIDESPDLSRLLIEYAAAKDDSDGHFTRFAGQPGKWEEQSEECRADWSRCCSRVRSAEDALAKFARLYVALQPKCSRCDDRGRVSLATEDYHGEPICQGCHDSIGEAQDERAAAEQY